MAQQRGRTAKLAPQGEEVQPKTPLGQILGTDDPDQQVEVAKVLVNPTVSVVLTVDPKQDRLLITPISILPVTPEMLQRMFAMGQEEIVRQLVAKATENQTQATGASPELADQPPAPPPPLAPTA